MADKDKEGKRSLEARADAFSRLKTTPSPLPVPMALKTWCDETYCDQDCHKTINLNFIFLNKSKKVEKKPVSGVAKVDQVFFSTPKN